MAESESLLSTGQVADLFGVDPATVTRWAMSGRLKFIRTLGGHRRYKRSVVMNLLKESSK